MKCSTLWGIWELYIHKKLNYISIHNCSFCYQWITIFLHYRCLNFQALKVSLKLENLNTPLDLYRWPCNDIKSIEIEIILVTLFPQIVSVRNHSITNIYLLSKLDFTISKQLSQISKPTINSWHTEWQRLPVNKAVSMLS